MTTEEKTRIEKFISILDKVRNSKFRKETKTLSFQLNFEAGKPIEQTLSGFDEDDFRSMLMDLRKITLTQDSVQIEEIADLIIKNATNPEIIANVEKCKTLYKELMTRPVVQMIINEEFEKTSAIVEKWLYGHYIHEKPKHEKSLEDLGLAQTIHKYNFLTAMDNLLVVAAWIANNGKLLIDQVPTPEQV